MNSVPPWKRLLAALLAAAIATALLPAHVRAESEADDSDLVVTILGVGDFHGHMTSEQSDSDPGAPRFVTFVDQLKTYYQETTGYNPIVLLAGDNYFGQHVSNLFLGEPGLMVLNRINARYSTIGNHEFSFGNRLLTESFGITNQAERAAFLQQHNITNPLFNILGNNNVLNSVQPGVQFLSADLRYEDGTAPSWVQPYAIIDDWYEAYGIRIAVVGITGDAMYATVDPHNREGLSFMFPGTAVVSEDESFGFFEDLINGLRADGVQAVIALTHTAHGASSNTMVDTLLTRGNAHFDAWISAHSHTYASETRVYPIGSNGADVIRSTEIVSGGHHGRGFGQLQFHFNNGELSLVTSQVYGAANGNAVREVDPDPEVLEWVFGQGATWTRDGLNIVVDASNAGTNRDLWGWYQARIEWGDQLGPRGVYGRNQHTRNQYLVYLMHDYIMRVHPEDITESGANGLIVMNNQSAWRGQGPHRLQWRPSDYVRTTDFLDALTFENTLPLFEMRGRDVIELLNMPAGPNPPGGAAGAERDPETGLPNWGTMQGQTVAGAFLHNGVWHLSATLQPISQDGIYLFGASNHMFGGHVGTQGIGEVAGGQNMPLPGNTFGNALGFGVNNFVGGQLELNENRYYSGPRFAMRDPQTGRHLTIQAAWRLQAEYRDRNQENIAAMIEVNNVGGGNTTLDIWGFEARPNEPGNQSYWGPPAMLLNTAGAAGSWTGEQNQRDLVLRGAVVRATATPADGFVGWFTNEHGTGAALSYDPVYIFTANEDKTIFGLWHDEVVQVQPPYIPYEPPVTQPPVEEAAPFDAPVITFPIGVPSLTTASLDGDHIMLPLRTVVEAFNGVIIWNPDTASAYITMGNQNLTVTVSVPLPYGIGNAALLNERVFVPIAYITNVLGLEVIVNMDVFEVNVTF